MATKSKTSASKNKKVDKKDTLLESKKTTTKKTSTKKTTTNKSPVKKNNTTKKSTTSKKTATKKTTATKTKSNNKKTKTTKKPKTINITVGEKEELIKESSVGESTQKLENLKEELQELYNKTEGVLEQDKKSKKSKKEKETNINIEKFVFTDNSAEVIDKTYKILNRITWTLFIIFMILLIAFITFIIYVCTY